jgi:hypothetical protein
VFSDNIGAQTLGAIDLFIFAGLAATMAMAFRRWARRTIEERDRQRQRQQGGRRAPSRSDHGQDEPAPAVGSTEAGTDTLGEADDSRD